METLEERNLLAGIYVGSELAAAMVDDNYEENDTRATARNLGTLTSNLTINNLVQADANDWYRFTTTRAGVASSSVSIAFQHARGDLDLELYNSAGLRLRVSQGITNGENISLNGFAAGTYFVRVFGYRGITNPNYSLGINLGSSALALVDDAYENNDTLATAYNLGTLSTNTSLSNLRLADSADWFRFTTAASGTSTNRVSIIFQNSQGNLALQLYNSAGTLLGTSNGTGNSESISLNGRAAGTFYARIYSAMGAMNPNYSLQIIAPTPPPPPPPPAPVSTTGGFDIQIVYNGFTASQRAIFEQAAGRWESIIVGDLPNAVYNGVVVDDLLIHASATPIDGVGGTLGQAGFDRIRTTGTRLPYHGSMEFDTADLASMEANGSLLNVIVHEIGHVLGIGTLWPTKGLIVGAGTSNPLFTGRQAVAAYNAIFGTNASGVPLESGGGSGTRDAHWRESTFNNEIMTGFINAGSNPLSRITVASLADMGYTVNMAAANAYTRPSTVAPTSTSSSSTNTSARLLSADTGATDIDSTFAEEPQFVRCLCRGCTGAPPTAAPVASRAITAPDDTLLALWNSYESSRRQASASDASESSDVLPSSQRVDPLVALFASQRDWRCIAAD